VSAVAWQRAFFAWPIRSDERALFNASCRGAGGPRSMPPAASCAARGRRRPQPALTPPRCQPGAVRDKVKGSRCGACVR
jgi:hypothetical protein